jgi:hypothetical protein
MPGGRALLASLCLTAALACTKINEQPPLPPPAPEPVRPKVVRGPRTGVHRSVLDQPAAALASAPGPGPVDAAAPRADTLNGEPGGPKRADMQKAIDSAMPSFQPCFREAKGSVNVSLAFSAAPSGRAEQVRVTGGGPVVDGCLAKALGQLKLPAFTGAAVPIQFPLAVERTVTPAPTAAASAAPANPPPPSVFVKP